VGELLFPEAGRFACMKDARILHPGQGVPCETDPPSTVNRKIGLGKSRQILGYAARMP
jgi:hypothetical protein